jgi:hypothetical protein
MILYSIPHRIGKSNHFIKNLSNSQFQKGGLPKSETFQSVTNLEGFTTSNLLKKQAVLDTVSKGMKYRNLTTGMNHCRRRQFQPGAFVIALRCGLQPEEAPNCFNLELLTTSILKKSRRSAFYSLCEQKARVAAGKNGEAPPEGYPFFPADRPRVFVIPASLPALHPLTE